MIASEKAHGGVDAEDAVEQRAIEMKREKTFSVACTPS